jgi:hypothetical protein
MGRRYVGEPKRCCGAYRRHSRLSVLAKRNTTSLEQSFPIVGIIFLGSGIITILQYSLFLRIPYFLVALLPARGRLVSWDASSRVAVFQGLQFKLCFEDSELPF